MKRDDVGETDKMIEMWKHLKLMTELAGAVLGDPDKKDACDRGCAPFGFPLGEPGNGAGEEGGYPALLTSGRRRL